MPVTGYSCLSKWHEWYFVLAIDMNNREERQEKCLGSETSVGYAEALSRPFRLFGTV